MHTTLIFCDGVLSYSRSISIHRSDGRTNSIRFLQLNGMIWNMQIARMFCKVHDSDSRSDLNCLVKAGVRFDSGWHHFCEGGKSHRAIPGSYSNNTMSKLNTEDLLAEEIKDLYSAETQLIKALPKMAKAASNPDLASAFESHLEETKGHVERLKEVSELLGITPTGKTCKAMQGLIEEGDETIKEKGVPSFKDLALITAAQKVEHYEISGYGSARALAKRIGLKDVVKLLQTTENEEGAADKKLTTIAEDLYSSVREVTD